MKVESPSFTEKDVSGFLTDYYEHERGILIARLKKVIEDTEALLPSIVDQGKTNGDSWNALETLAHMATSSQFFGWLASEVSKKGDGTGDPLEMIKMRDIVGNQAVELPIEDLAKQLRENLERTISFIQRVDYQNLRRTFNFVGHRLSGEDVIRIPLCGHMESHISQIREALSQN
jgi:hypothetical protein